MRGLLGIILIISSNVFAQDFDDNVGEVFDASEITFFGFDFSHFKLAEAKRINEEILQYIPTWIEYTDLRFPEKELAKLFRKKQFFSDFEYTKSLCNGLTDHTFVSWAKHYVSADSIQSYIGSYNINQVDGVGYVVIVECFHKVSKETSAYHVFFDVMTKKILMIDYITVNEVDGYGLTNYWGAGLRWNLIIYTKKYSKRLKSYLKFKKKNKGSYSK